MGHPHTVSIAPIPHRDGGDVTQRRCPDAEWNELSDRVPMDQHHELSTPKPTAFVKKPGKFERLKLGDQCSEIEREEQPTLSAKDEI